MSKKKRKKAYDEELPVPETPESPVSEHVASDDGMPVADDDDEVGE